MAVFVAAFVLVVLVSARGIATVADQATVSPPPWAVETGTVGYWGGWTLLPRAPRLPETLTVGLVVPPRPCLDVLTVARVTHPTAPAYQGC
jgi:hypothetical protein